MVEDLMMQYADPRRLEIAMKELETIMSSSLELQERQRKLLAWLLLARKQYGTAIMIPVKDHTFRVRLFQKIPGLNMNQPPLVAAMHYGYDLEAFNETHKLTMKFSQMSNDKRVVFIRDLLKRKQYADARVLITFVKGPEADKLRQQLKSISATSSSSSTSTSVWIKLLAILLGLCLLSAVSIVILITL